jgi:hypothetical protein
MALRLRDLLTIGRLAATAIQRVKMVFAMNAISGDYEAYELNGRIRGRKMEAAFLTHISPKWLSFTPGQLSATAQDWDASKNETRPHHSQITLDPRSPLQGVRVLSYANEIEIARQRIEVGESPNELIVTPSESGYNKHILRRTHRTLDF